jgi:hypothetical protein
MRRRPTKSLPWLLALFALGPVGCGGASGTDSSAATTHLAFDLEGHHYEYQNAYYDVLGTVPVTAYTLEFSDLPCATEDRPIGSDLDVQLFPSSTAPPYTVKVETPDPAAQDTYLEGSGTVELEQALPQIIINDMTAQQVAALNETFTGTVEFQISGGGQSVTASGAFSATHCPRMDNP